MRRKIIDLLQTTPLFIFLLPVFFIHIGYNELFGFLSAGIVIRNFIGVSLGILSLYISSWLYLKRIRNATLFAFILSLFVLFFGYFHDLLKSSLFSSFLSIYSVFIPVSALLFIFLAIWFRKREKTLNRTYQFLNALMIILVCLESIKSIYAYDRIRETENLIDPRFSVYKEFQKYGAVADSLKPDIYFIIFDEMASSYSLKKYLGKENDMLDQALYQEGFFIIKKSRSNYNQTVFSMSSILNMEYIPENGIPVKEDLISNMSCVKSISRNSMLAILKDQKYTISQYHPFNQLQKEYAPVPGLKEIIECHFFYKTLPGRIRRDIFWNVYQFNLFNIQQNLNDYKWDQNTQRKREINDVTRFIKNSCSKKGNPKFVYGHYILPHSPYSFNRNGEILPSNTNNPLEKNSDPRGGYYEQVLYSNNIINDLVTHIKRKNRKNTIIMIMGDHGYRDDLGVIDISGSYYNLSAIYFPDQNYESIHDSLSAVNIFRVVLNKYFNTKLRILKDSTVMIRKSDLLN